MWGTERYPFVGYRYVAVTCDHRLCYSLLLIQEIRYSRSVIRAVQHDPSRFTRPDLIVSEVLFYAGVRNCADHVVTITNIFVVYFYSDLPYWSVSYVNCPKGSSFDGCASTPSSTTAARTLSDSVRFSLLWRSSSCF